MDQVTESGLIVTTRHTRADDPRSWPPNDNVDPPPPAETVGPNASEGFGNTHVMYPAGLQGPMVQAWSGWPVEWSTPNWGSAVGLSSILERVSTVFGAIDLNASILSTMPPYRVDRDDQRLDPLPWMLNPQPEVYTGWTEAMKQVVTAYFWNGEAFLWATSRYSDGPGGTPGTVRTWVMLNPAWVDIEMTGHVRRFTMGGLDITADVLHIRYSSWPGEPHGHGPLEALARNLFGAAALEHYQAQLSVRGGIPWGVLTAPGNLSAAQATSLRDGFVAARASSMGAPATLSGGVTLTPFTINPKDMALLELRQFDEARIATLLSVPPTLLNLPSGEGSLTYRNAEGIYDFHWRAYLRPKAAALMEAISGWALTGPQRVEVDRDEYVRPGPGERATMYATLFGIYDPATGKRAITIDEIREAERLPDEQPDATPAPPPAPVPVAIAPGGPDVQPPA